MMKRYIVFLVFLSVNVAGKDFFSMQERTLFKPFSSVFNAELSDPSLSKLDPSIKHSVERYRQAFESSAQLEKTCQYDQRAVYRTSEQLELVQKSIMANLQQLILNKTVESVARLSRDLDYSDEEFEKMTHSIVDNYCSKNFTILSLKNVKKKFIHQFKTENLSYPKLNVNDRYSQFYEDKWNLPANREKMLYLSLRSFRAMCSWDGDLFNYRLLAPYMSDPLIMSYVFRAMQGQELDVESGSVKPVKKEERLLCSDLICRRASADTFLSSFPKMIGSVGLENDLKIVYCQHFENQRAKTRDQEPLILNWMKETDLELQRHEILHFHSLLHEMPYFFLALDKFSDFKDYLFKGIAEKFDKWSKKALENDDKELLYEESIHFRVNKSWSEQKISQGNLAVLFEVGLGEFDSSFGIHDKIDVSIPIKIPSKFIVWAAERAYFLEQLDPKSPERKDLRNRLRASILPALKVGIEEIRLPWKEDRLVEVILPELERQLSVWASYNIKKPEFSSPLTTQTEVSVKIYFGIFALQLMREKFLFNEPGR